jgi:hypothetical protein
MTLYVDLLLVDWFLNESSSNILSSCFGVSSSGIDTEESILLRKPQS